MEELEELIEAFQIDKISLENGLLEKQAEIYKLYANDFYVIDHLPKVIETMEWFEPFNIFYRPEHTAAENKRYFQMEAIFLKSLTMLAAYSTVWVESSYFYNDQCFGIESLSKEEKDYLLGAQGNKLLKISLPFELQSFLKLSLRDYELTIMYLPTLKSIFWVKDLFITVFTAEHESVEFIKMVCMTEGLYFRTATIDNID